MASLPNTITIEAQLRPCKFYEDGTFEIGVFHEWVTVSSNRNHPERMVVKGIVECEDGNIYLVDTGFIHFTDGLAKAVLEETDTLHIADDTPENKMF